MKWSCDADPKCLAGIRESVRNRLAGRLSPEELDEVCLGVGEACANVVKHAYHGQGGPLEVRLELDDEGFTLEFRDQGEPPDPKRITPRPLDEVRPGGLGTHFMRCAFDEMTYHREADGTNVLTARRRWRRPPPADSGG